MKPPRDNSYIGVATPNFREAADFYIRHFAYAPISETSDFVSVRSPNGKRCLGFGNQPAAAPTAPPSAQGIHLSFLVENAEESLSHFESEGVQITRGIDVGNWGVKHFIVTDPAGLELYISESAS